eukprot:TRINITY_DN48188_c0_g1_i1.p1 TRINITY_DN48188_c0_g1~~TRINITY_DN48188_c0_g1_i1.p1  ORF type:complete len:111 (+),score=3.52 TRINITY_DN48188_c0_g1_i1:18-350(+)
MSKLPPHSKYCTPSDISQQVFCFLLFCFLSENCRCQFLLIASNKDEYIPLDKAPQTPNMVVALKDAGCHVSDFVDDFGGHWELVTNPNKLVDMVSDYTAKLEGPTAVATC